MAKDVLIHSSDTIEVFLRVLISNASGELGKIHYKPTPDPKKTQAGAAADSGIDMTKYVPPSSLAP